MDLIEHPLDLMIKEINSLYNFYNSLENKLFSDTYNNGKYIELYLIEKGWLNNWKNLIFYNNIESYLKDNHKKEINFEEFMNIYKIKSALYLPKLNNNDIYNTNKGDDYYNNLYDIKKISLIDKVCWDLFSLGNYTDAVICHGLYKKNKLIVGLNNNDFYIIDFSNNSKKEIYIIFNEDNKRNSLIIQEIINTDNLDNFFNSSKFPFNDKTNQIIIYNEQAFLYRNLSKASKNDKNINNSFPHSNSKINKNNIKQKTSKVKKNINKNKAINNGDLDYLNKPCLVGLNNIGATCYMNAVLQCFSNIKNLTNYLFKSDVIQKIEENRDSKILSYEYLQLIKHLWLYDKNNIEIYGENKCYSPKEFKNTLGQLNTLFNKNEANDSKDLIIYMEEQIHNELNFLLEERPIVNENNNIIFNQFNELDVSTNYYKNFAENYNSIISHLFYGTQKTVTQCTFCGQKTYNYQIFSNLIFPLEAVRQFKGYQSFGNKTTYVNLEDCFDHFQEMNYFTGMNRISCNFCRNLSDAYYFSKIAIAPNILILILNRGKGLEFNVNLNINEFINIKQYTEHIDSPFKYELVGSIIHFGNSGQDGHFIAICKNKNDRQWYKYNDSIVTKTNFNEIRTIGIPYVLFYQKI